MKERILLTYNSDLIHEIDDFISSHENDQHLTVDEYEKGQEISERIKKEDQNTLGSKYNEMDKKVKEKNDKGIHVLEGEEYEIEVCVSLDSYFKIKKFEDILKRGTTRN